VTKLDCNNYRGISLLSTSYKILSNIILSRLSPYIDEIIGDHQCGFQHNRSITDQIFCIMHYAISCGGRKIHLDVIIGLLYIVNVSCC
jgi:hypothetical protein